MDPKEEALRREIITSCREMNACGINQGTSGNISVRLGKRMLITPSGVPYDALEPAMIAAMALDDPTGTCEGPLQPSTEWRFHRQLLAARPDAAAVVHAHPTWCTALAIARREIPACHYMIAAFGGDSVRCAGYARFGSPELADLAVAAMTDRTACLLANHGMITIGDTLARAMWRAVELEALARQYCAALSIGSPVILDRAAIDETLAAFAHYGPQDPTSAEG